MSYVINIYARTAREWLIAFATDATTSNYQEAISDVRDHLGKQCISPVLALIKNEIKEVSPSAA